MAALLDTVTLEDWRDVVAGALQLGKGGVAQARAWLAQYLVGKASASAPTALTVHVNQWSGKDPLTERLARPLIQQEKFPLTARDVRWPHTFRTPSRRNWCASYLRRKPLQSQHRRGIAVIQAMKQ